MAHTLKIIKVTPADVESDVVDIGTYLNEYVPSSLSIDAVMSDPEATITETAIYYCDKATIALIETEVNDIEEAFAMARNHHNTGGGDRYYVKFQTSGGTNAYRSEIVDGRVRFDSKTLDYEWITKMVTVRVVWTRRAYWEENSETELSLSNGNGSGTGGVSVDNADDGNQDNYVGLTGSAITGALPTPLRITMKNETGGGIDVKNIHIGLNTFNASSFTHVIEGEDATGLSSSPANASASDGNYGRRSLGSSYTAIYWSITGAQLEYANGRYFRVLASLFNQTPVGDTWIRLKVLYSSTLLWVGEAVHIGSVVRPRLIDLGIVQLPPTLGGSWDMAALRFQLEAKCSVSGDLDLDFLQLTPTDSYQHLKQAGSYSVDNNAFVVDDGVYNRVYGENTSGDKYPLWVGHGDHLYAHPGKNSRLIFLWDRSNSAMTLSDALTARVYYRPRVLTI